MGDATMRHRALVGRAGTPLHARAAVMASPPHSIYTAAGEVPQRDSNPRYRRMVEEARLGR
jgi:hypothetical protein